MTQEYKSPIKHSMKRRRHWHDYNDKGIYMLTMVVEGRKNLFGNLKGDYKIKPGEPGAPYIELTELGEFCQFENPKILHEKYPFVHVWKICVMPDHIHMIVYVEKPFKPKRSLGNIVSGFKGGVSRRHRLLSVCSRYGLNLRSNPEERERMEDLAKKEELVPVFEEGYNDQILTRHGQLENWKHYLADNPRRLAIKQKNPQLFNAISNYNLVGQNCQIYGNVFLLDKPEKMAVIVHRAYTDADFEEYKRKWLEFGEAGGVLVSPAISPREREVMHIAMERGYSVIFLKENGFPKLYKPSGRTFDFCANGQLLMISPWQYHYEKRKITRQQCLFLNDMAEKIAQEK